MVYIYCPPAGSIDELMICPACASKATCMTISPKRPTTLECGVCSRRHLLTRNDRGNPEWVVDR